MPARTIKVNYLARVEGEGGLFIRVKNGHVADCELRIFEPPRFFEAFLQGRAFHEAPDITARICGICPVAYQMSAVQAMELAFGIQIDPAIRQLRRLLYCGEWIESHALHVFMLHAPDFLGYESAIHMAKDHPQVVQDALAIKKTGNELMQLVGGRSVHPINVKVGGLHRAPRRNELLAHRIHLEKARDLCVHYARFLSGLTFPDFERDYHLVAMRHSEEYAITEGKLVSNRGLCIEPPEYEQHFVEHHVRHSTALQSTTRDGSAYMVGPMARFALNFDRLSPLARDEARRIGLSPETRNPFKSILIRTIELIYACEESLRIIEEYREPERAAVDVTPAAAFGFAWTEAPRGVLYHRYQMDENGRILVAKIVPPTSQNQQSMEQDLRAFVQARLTLPEEQLQWQCEQAVRNYDPCISCSTHFLKLTKVAE
jgi:sulfhydrogenase subunit alpha